MSDRKKSLSASSAQTRAARGRAVSLLDRTFWRFLSGFVLVLIISLSLLAVLGVWREAAENFALLVRMF